MKKNKYIRITFSNGACYDLQIEEVFTHYAKHIIKQTEITDTPFATKKAEEHFKDNPEDLLEYVSGAMSWDEVVLDAITIQKAPFVNKHSEWHSAKKELIAR